ncbi:MAG: GNAT family N-acetyltransferase [Bacteroidaceae bacterium]|nr:GNAT family N-acetyltransferase [Bacteroidaceae bacterium]
MDFYRKTGQMAVGSRLRALTEKVTADAADIYELYEVELRPKWFPVFFALTEGEGKTVTAIAREIGHTHPSVSNILKEMKQAGLVRFRQGRSDARQTVASLSPKGRSMTAAIMLQYEDVARAIDELHRESRHDLWAAIAEWERLLGEKSLLQRVAELKEARERTEVEIVPFDDAQHHAAFRALNEEWIRDLFGVVEEADYYEFDHPVENILEKGGYIFIALLRGEPVGTFAMMRCANPKYDYELVKFAVSPRAQGHGIGRRLIEACIAQARRTGGYRLFLESNYKCAAAVHLYERYGFRHLKGENSPYARCDVQMELELQ